MNESGKTDQAAFAITAELLALLRCPETQQAVMLASVEVVARLEAERAAGRLRDRGGRAVEGPVGAGLMRADGQLLFRIVDGLPVMLIDEAIVVPV